MDISYLSKGWINAHAIGRRTSRTAVIQGFLR